MHFRALLKALRCCTASTLGAQGFAVWLPLRRHLLLGVLCPAAGLRKSKQAATWHQFQQLFPRIVLCHCRKGTKHTNTRKQSSTRHVLLWVSLLEQVLDQMDQEALSTSAIPWFYVPSPKSFQHKVAGSKLSLTWAVSVPRNGMGRSQMA